MLGVTKGWQSRCEPAPPRFCTSSACQLDLTALHQLAVTACLALQGNSRSNAHEQGVYDQHGRQQQPVGSQLGYGGQPDAAALAAALSTQLQVDSSDQRGEGCISAGTLPEGPASPLLSSCRCANA